MRCSLHPAAPGPTTPVTPPSVPHCAVHCHLVRGCRPNAPAQSPVLSLQLIRLVVPLCPFTSDLQPQPCWGASPLPSCLLSWWLAPPTPCMYVHVHLFIREWILGDSGSTSFFKHHQLSRCSMPASASSAVPVCSEKPGCRSGHAHFPAPHTGSGLREGGLSARSVGRALRHPGRTAGCAADHGPCPSADQPPGGCRWLLWAGGPPPGRAGHAERHRHSVPLP